MYELAMTAVMQLSDIRIEARARADYWLSGRCDGRRAQIIAWGVRRYGPAFRADFLARWRESYG